MTVVDTLSVLSVMASRAEARSSPDLIGLRILTRNRILSGLSGGMLNRSVIDRLCYGIPPEEITLCLRRLKAEGSIDDRYTSGNGLEFTRSKRAVS
jgi:hypothetical protein